MYYELAIRHYLAKPIVHIISAGEEAPFDVNQMRYVSFDIKDPDSIEVAQRELLAHVKALEAGERVVTPIQIAQILAESTPAGEETALRDVLSALYVAFGNLQQELMETKQFARALYYESPARTQAIFSPNVISGYGSPPVSLSTLVGSPVSPKHEKVIVSEAEKVAAKRALLRNTFYGDQPEPSDESAPEKPAKDSPQGKKFKI